MLFRLIFVVFFALSDTVTDNLSSSVVNAEFIGYRLPNDTKPISYDIHLTTSVHKEKDEYTGVVTIALKVMHNTSKIVMHAGESIKILKVSLIDQDKASELGKVNYSRDSRNEFLTIFSDPEQLRLERGNELLLAIYFNGTHKYNQRGFYRSFEWTEDRKIIWIASTLFEPFSARVAFPCYDEPMFKAKFTVAITHTANYTALSNMPTNGDPIKIGNGMITTKFKQTPPMSVHTLAFLVGKYNKVSVEVRNITHSVFSIPDEKYKGDLALDASSASLNAFEDYFGIKYPLPKMDHVSTTHPVAAMENWGLVIYNTGHLVSYSNTSKGLSLKMSTTRLIVYETALQWLGNLVTPKWWNYIWLNEGLATFYSYKILEKLHPEWQPTEYGRLGRCSDLWDERESHAMTQYVENEPDVLTLFGKSIYYCKGDKIMSMFEHALTNATLKKGVKSYLKKYQYSNVEENDLFECLQEAATEDMIPQLEKPGTVNKIMSSWTQQSNYPCITVERDYSSGTFKLIQSPIETESGKNDTKDAEHQLWWIPITFATTTDSNFHNTTTDFFLPNIQNLTIDPKKFNKTLRNEDWLLLNKQQIGFYQVTYDNRNLNLIIDALNKDPKVIPSYNKMQLIRDAGYLEEKSELSSKILYNLLSYLEKEEDILPWFEAFKVMENLIVKLRQTRVFDYFRFFGKNIIKNILEKIGTDRKPTDTPIMKRFRTKFYQIYYKLYHYY